MIIMEFLRKNEKKSGFAIELLIFFVYLQAV